MQLRIARTRRLRLEVPGGSPSGLNPNNAVVAVRVHSEARNSRKNKPIIGQTSCFDRFTLGSVTTTLKFCLLVRIRAFRDCYRPLHLNNLG